MAKLGTRQGIFARTWLAGCLAWLLALQGLVTALPLPQEHPSQTATGHALTLKGEDCGASHSPDPAVPCHHLPCACCILCLIGHGEGTLVVFAVLAFIFAAFPFRETATAIAWYLISTGAKPPPGWISSWSQRAPPLFSLLIPLQPGCEPALARWPRRERGGCRRSDLSSHVSLHNDGVYHGICLRGRWLP